MYTILVVDDSPFIVDVFVTMLERGGYRTVAAYGGHGESLNIELERDFDVDEVRELLRNFNPANILAVPPFYAIIYNL